MWHPLSMFSEKDGTEKPFLSMTRVVALMFALTYCYVLIRNSSNAHTIGWPFCTLGVVTLMAVPLQSLFKNVQSWLATPPGKKAIEGLLSKLVPESIGGGTPSTTVTTAVETKPSGAG